ncbi:uncharacterized protein EV154DRAFT_394124, partial [Mucor mucedo]|uniref:uncharacterized protein n=1 Tax=Mucor mucedo TaxID=29922 RepID=UPI00221E5B01
LFKYFLTCSTAHAFSLSLSGIYNYINPHMKNMYFQKLNKSPPGASESHTNSSVLQAMSYIYVLIHENKTIDDMLSNINLGKARLLQDTLIDSDSDKAHVILEK